LGAPFGGHSFSVPESTKLNRRWPCIGPLCCAVAPVLGVFWAPMNDQARSLALVIAGLAFVAFLLGKLLLPLGSRRRPAYRQGQARLAEARRRARDRGLSVAERATALREAAVAALEDLERPNLAASYARRAERLEPENADAVGLVASSLRRTSRFRALERMLWRRLSSTESSSGSYQRALHELIDLYAGPLKRPEVAEALRRMSQAI
jgi:hypothetical protein